MQGVLQADAGMQIAVSGKDYAGAEILLGAFIPEQCAAGRSHKDSVPVASGGRACSTIYGPVNSL